MAAPRLLLTSILILTTACVTTPASKHTGEAIETDSDARDTQQDLTLEDCTNGVDDDEDGDVDCDDDECTDVADCAQDVEPFEPAWLAFSYTVAWDGAGFTDYSVDGTNRLEPSFSFYLIDEDYFNTYSDEDLCTWTNEMVLQPNPSLQGDLYQSALVDKVSFLGTSCEGLDLDYWGGEDEDGVLSNMIYNLAWGNPIDDLEEDLRTTAAEQGLSWETDFAPYVLGGFEWFEALGTIVSASLTYCFAYELDGDGVMQFESDGEPTRVPIEAFSEDGVPAMTLLECHPFYFLGTDVL